jgi:hypothetical protein
VQTALQYTAAARNAVLKTFMSHDIVRGTLGDFFGEKVDRGVEIPERRQAT